MVSVDAGDYYATVTVRMSESGYVYAYPLPADVQIAPDDETIVTYGYSAIATAGEDTRIIVEELEARSSYTLFVTGRDEAGQMSSPSRLIRVVTTLPRSPRSLSVMRSDSTASGDGGLHRREGIGDSSLLHERGRNDLVPRVHRGGAPVRDGGGCVQERARPAGYGARELELRDRRAGAEHGLLHLLRGGEPAAGGDEQHAAEHGAARGDAGG